MSTERIEPRSRAASPAPWITDVAARRTARERIEVVDHVRPGRGRAVDPRVTVVLITFERRAEALETLQRLERVPERPHVIVVLNASGDGTSESVREAHPWAELVALAGNAGAAARNLGVRLASTPYVAFNDDDTWWEPGSLTIAADVLDAHPGIASLTATILVEPGGREDPVVHDMRVSALRDDPGLPGTPLLSVLAGASVVRRSAFLGVGGFEPKLLIGGEEELLSADLASAGWSLRHLPDLVVHHRASQVRDAHLRRRQGIRNTLWYQWLRRPAFDALRRTVATLRAADHDIVTAMGVADAMTGIVWVLRERRVVPADVAAGLRSLDQQQLRSKARRYVS
jgi:GT2 family glycosyltransferase